MITAWTRHIKDEHEKQQFESSLLHSKWLLDHLKTILVSMDEDHERAEISPKVYDLPNWENRQADSNGYRRCLKQITKLITLDPKEQNERPISAS